MSRDRWLRGEQEGRHRPIDWRALAKRYGIAEDDAHRLYEEARRRARGHREPHRHEEAIYLELLEEARHSPRRPAPGKVTRTMRLAAGGSAWSGSGQAVAPGKVTRTQQAHGARRPGRGPVAPGKVTLTSYLKPQGARAGRAAEEAEYARLREHAWVFESAGLPLPRELAAALARHEGKEEAAAPEAPPAPEAPRENEAMPPASSPRAGWTQDDWMAAALGFLPEPKERAAEPARVLEEREDDEPRALPLPADTRARMERAFGQRFDDVVVHPESPEVTGDMHALARDREIHFRGDAYAPGTTRGDWLIGHELTHVVQQTGGTTGSHTQGPALEAEANASADAIMAGRRAVVQMRAPMGAAQAYRDDEATIHGTPVGKQGIVSHRDGVNLRDRPLPGDGSNVLRRLPFNTTLFVDTETSDGWYHVTLSTGEFGYVVKTHVNANIPEPTAKLHEIASGETAIGIAERYYGSHVERGEDLRFYVNVLEFVNRGPGERGIYKQRPDDAWEETRAREGYLIWIPGVAFARSLKGKVKSGSISYEAWSAVKDAATAVGEFVVGGGAFVAGLLHGALESLWDILVGLKDLGVMAWNVLKSVFTGSVLSDAKALYDQIGALDLGELVAGWIDDFEKKWNDDGIMKRWQFRGWVIGYAIMEIVLLVASFGTVTGAKWAGKAAKLAKAITSLPRVQKTIKAVKSIKVPPKLQQGLNKVFKGGDKLDEAAKGADNAADAGKAGQIAADLSKAPDTAGDLIKKHWARWSERARRQYMEALDAVKQGKALVRKMSDAELDAYQKAKRGQGAIDDVFPPGAEGNKAFRIDEKYTFQKSARDAAPGYEASIQIPLEGGLREHLIKNMVPDRVGGKMPQELKSLPRFKLESDGYTIIISKSSWHEFSKFISWTIIGITRQSA